MQNERLASCHKVYSRSREDMRRSAPENFPSISAGCYFAASLAPFLLDGRSGR